MRALVVSENSENMIFQMGQNPLDTIDKWKVKIAYAMNESLNFKRGQDPLDSMGIGLKHIKYIKMDSLFMAWDKIKKIWITMVADSDPKEEYFSTYNHTDLSVSCYKYKNSNILCTTCIWNDSINRWEFMTQYGIKESIYFSRGQDPLVSMGIGRRAPIIKWFEDLEISPDKYEIKPDLSIFYNGDLDLNSTKISSLPDNLIVNGALDLGDTKITSLPYNLIVNGDLYLRNTKITSLPDSLTVKGSLDLNRSQIASLPDNLTVNGWLNLSNTKITSLPYNLTVNGDLDLGDTKISSLSKSLKVKGNIYKDF